VTPGADDLARSRGLAKGRHFAHAPPLALDRMTLMDSAPEETSMKPALAFALTCTLAVAAGYYAGYYEGVASSSPIASR
jgi:hypothetical protein